MGADIVLFPELWYMSDHHFVERSWRHDYELWRGKHLWGKAEWHPDQKFEEQIGRWHAQAIGRDDPYIRHFQRLAQELRMAIALTYLERWPIAHTRCGILRGNQPCPNGHHAGTKEAAAHLTFTQKHSCPQDGEEGAELEKGGHVPNKAKCNGGEAKERGDSWEARWRRKELVHGDAAPARFPCWKMTSLAEMSGIPLG